jgi:[ribosomal protein S5]-alanine N-acetyltransferase
MSPVATKRLDLVSLTAELVEALLAGRREDAERVGGFRLPDGWPDDHDVRFLRFRAGQMLKDRTWETWLVRGIVLRGAGRPLVGHAGFHGPPGVNATKHPDAVEVGYTVFPPFRRRGYAAEAVRALIGWAHDERGIRRVIASIGPGNVPSLALARRLGFREIGRHWDDEDGEELEFELTLG